MKQSNLSFVGGFLGIQAQAAANNPQKKFDWELAAVIIKEYSSKYPDLVAEAGLQEDWEYTGGTIFEKGHPTNDYSTYLSSNWAIPTLILSSGEEELQEVPCWTLDYKYNADSKWDRKSLKILGIGLL